MTESTPRTMPGVPELTGAEPTGAKGMDVKKTEVKKTEVKEEGNLLIEAVSLLVQRQRETEGWVAEQIWQAEERAAATERRYAELEARLVGIEEHLARLVHDVDVVPGGALDDERLARLREQVEGLKSVGADGYTNRAAPVTPPAPAAAPTYDPDVTRPIPTAPE